ncbi:hypothetical protein G210_2735, partial [Candida maltosa Xu316]
FAGFPKVDLVRAWKKVDLPTLASPTSPTDKLLDARPRIFRGVVDVAGGLASSLVVVTNDRT